MNKEQTQSTLPSPQRHILTKIRSRCSSGSNKEVEKKNLPFIINVQSQCWLCTKVLYT